MEFEDYKIQTKEDFTTISVFAIPIYQKSSLFQAEKTGPKTLIGKFYFDDNTGRITLHIPNILNYNLSHLEAPIPELLFSCIRPEDFIEVICPTKFRALKSKLLELGKIKNVKYLGDFRMIEKIKFVKLAWSTRP